MTRKDFTKAAAMTMVNLSVAARPSAARALGANDRINIGLIGAGGMGRNDLLRFMETKQVDVVAIADPYEPHLQQALGMTNGAAKGYKDFRHVLDSKQIDAVIIATPEHWHAIPMIMACQAGKDVYAEKPLSHTIYEGQRMIAAAKKYKRVVQVGTQQRSGEHFKQAVELVRSGKIGKVSSAEVFLYSNLAPEGYGNPPDGDPPPTLDWDLWLGPAPYHVYNPNRCIRTFRTFWDYGGGALTDNGAHFLDIVHWAMGVDAPLSATAVGGIYALPDNRETPDTLEVLYEYPASPVSVKGFVVRWSNRYANKRGPEARRHGMQFFGTDGTLCVDRAGFTLWRENSSEVVKVDAVSPNEDIALCRPHVKNFLECMRSRGKTNSDVETMHRSTSAPIIGNIAYRLGRKVRWDRDAEKFIGDSEANERLTKRYRKPWLLPEG